MITGIPAPKVASAKEENPWTEKQLKAGKPLLVYYFVDADRATDEADFDFSHKAEVSGAFSSDNVVQINKNWVAKKVQIAGDADHKLEKFQARIEFWSFTGKKLDAVTLKDQKALASQTFAAKLKDLEKTNRDLCDAELKRIQDLSKKPLETASR